MLIFLLGVPEVEASLLLGVPEVEPPLLDGGLGVKSPQVKQQKLAAVICTLTELVVVPSGIFHYYLPSHTAS